MPRIHHSAICTRDVEASLRFWRDGIGFEQMMDMEFEGDWPTLFDAATTSLRSIFLGDPASPNAGIVELVDLGEVPDGDGGAPPTVGFFLLSVYLDLEPTLERLAGLGFDDARRVTVHGVGMAAITDPNGIRVELIERSTARIT
jgi:glyoxylase I family protein